MRIIEENEAKVKALRSRFMGLPEKKFEELLELYHQTVRNLEYSKIKKLAVEAIEEGDRRKLWILLMNIWDQSEKDCFMEEYLFEYGFDGVFPYDWFDPTLNGWDDFPDDIMAVKQ